MGEISGDLKGVSPFTLRTDEPLLTLQTSFTLKALLTLNALLTLKASLPSLPLNALLTLKASLTLKALLPSLTPQGFTLLGSERLGYIAPKVRVVSELYRYGLRVSGVSAAPHDRLAHPPPLGVDDGEVPDAHRRGVDLLSAHIGGVVCDLRYI